MHLRNIFLLTLFISLTLSQEQLGSDIDGEAADDRSGYSVSLIQMEIRLPLEHI